METLHNSYKLISVRLSEISVSEKPDEKVATVGVNVQKWRNVNAHRSSRPGATFKDGHEKGGLSAQNYVAGAR